MLPMLYEAGWGWTTDSAHNAYLHVFLEMGIVGMLALIYFLVSLVWHLKNKDHVCMLLFISILSIMSSTYAGPGVSILMFLLVAMSNFVNEKFYLESTKE